MSTSQAASTDHNSPQTSPFEKADLGPVYSSLSKGPAVRKRSVQSATASAAAPAVYQPSRSYNPPVGRNGSVSGHAGVSRGTAPQGAQSETRPRNSLLSALDSEAWERLFPHVGRALLIEGQNLNHPGRPIERVYFPNTGLVSMIVNAHDGSQVEVGVVGREGLAADLSLLCGSSSLLRAVVQAAGTACWLPATVVREEFRRGGSFQQNLLQYFQVQVAQSSQCALCNRLHSVEERLCRWLMVIRDRLETDEIDITHEFIAHMLGTRRSGVTIALGVLQQAGLIDLSRGHISIRDANKLGASACECYSIITKQFQALNRSAIVSA